MSFPCVLSTTSECSEPLKAKKQSTLQRSVSISGIGLFTGEKTTLSVCPAKENTGIVFQRIDLPNKPLLPATLDYVQGTPRCTIIGKKGACVQTVEHVLAALNGLEIDNALIELSGQEVPILDGSAHQFVEMLEGAGIREQEASKNYHKLLTPVFWSQGDVHLIALPSPEYRVSYTLHYPHSPLLYAQYCSFAVTKESFKKEIAPCRTFSLYEEVSLMLEQGLLKGGSLENGIIIKGDTILNPEGVRFKDEAGRHKILDLIGDLSLIAKPFLAHIIAIRSGHASNNAFARHLLNHIKMEIHDGRAHF